MFQVYLQSMHKKIIKADKFKNVYKKKAEIAEVVNLNINQECGKVFK